MPSTGWAFWRTPPKRHVERLEHVETSAASHKRVNMILIGDLMTARAFGWGTGTMTSLLLALAQVVALSGPLCALILMVLSSRGSVMRGLRNGLITTALVMSGLAVIVLLGIMWAVEDP